METRHSTLMAAALLSAAVGGGLPVNANQQPAAPSVASAPAVPTLGPQVGERVPDDKICFNPQSVPLTWTIGAKPLDRERAKR